MVTISAILTTLFFGAWHLPFVSDAKLLSFFEFAGPNGAGILAMLVNVVTFFTKVIFFIWLQMTIRWTLPRFRYDQVMRLCWKMILPLSLINITITGLVLLLWITAVRITFDESSQHTVFTFKKWLDFFWD